MNVLIGLGACLLAGCWGVGSSVDVSLVGNYALLAGDTREDMSLVKKLSKSGAIGIVGATVFAAGWNSDFIMVMQHPGSRDRSITNFFILRVKDEKLVGPLTKAMFEEQRKALGVPQGLDFKLVFDDLK